jgi:hypothetical protein
MSLTTPVAFFIFNRPHLTERVFQAIADVRPKRLLVVADGPRSPEENEKCQKVRAIISKIDWDCEVLTNFSDTNLGCKKRISSGLDWIFSEVEEAIILEDDCLPGRSFFFFCQSLLEHYRNDERVMMISGNNFERSQNESRYSYYFSKYFHIWGWATWRRAWKHYDLTMREWPGYKKLGLIESVCEDPWEREYWTRIFDLTHMGKIETWAYQWWYTCWSQGGFSIMPKSNLVSNIGGGADATHFCDRPGDPRLGIQIVDLWKMEHPPYLFRNVRGDLQFFVDYLGGRKREPLQLSLIISSIRSFLRGRYDWARRTIHWT